MNLTSDDGDGSPAPATEAWWKLACALRTLGADTGFDDLRDVLWLAEQLPREGVSRRRRRAAALAAPGAPTADAGAAAATRAPPGATGAPASTPRPPETRRVALEDEDTGAALYAGSSRGAGTAARRVRLPAPHPLPDALAIGRALLPVTRRRPSGPAVLLDEEATAEAIAHTELEMPVLRRRRERWFELLLAVDDAPSMLAWRARVDEFEALLHRAGFRDVRRVALRAAGNGPAELRSPAGALLSPAVGTPGAATAARLLLVVSDAAAAAWHDGRVSALLAPWARELPLALVQPLPPALWPHTAAGFAELQLAADAPGQVTARLHERRPGWARGEPGLVLPVMALEESALRAWARMVMAAGDAWCRAALLPPADDGAAAAATSPAPAEEAGALLEAFRAASTPEALELAAAFAVIRPLNLPVMRLIQAVMLPQAGAEALAQVLMSGLLQRVGDAAGGPARDEDIGYEIDDAARDQLATHLTRSRWWQVNLAVQRFVEIETGVGFDFMAFIEDPLGLEQVAPSALPFAQLAARMAQRFVPGRNGGAARRRYAEEPVFAPGLTIQARARLPSAVRRLAWSPGGSRLAVLHALGAEVLSNKGLALLERERLAPDLLVWVVHPADLEMLRPLMERVSSRAEAMWQRAFVHAHAAPMAPAEPRPGEALRLVALTARWTASSAANAASASAVKGVDGVVLDLSSGAGRTRPPVRGDPLTMDWRGVLDRPVADATTDSLIDALCARLGGRAPRGAIDALAWAGDAADERLLVVGRESRLPDTSTAVYADAQRVKPLQPPEPEHCVVAEYASLGHSVHWLRGGNAYTVWLDGAQVILHTEPPRVARFGPDGSALAMIDDRGRFSLMPMPAKAQA